jgi:hypothetical protein
MHLTVQHTRFKIICIITPILLSLWCNNINAMASNYLYKREFVKSQKEKGLCVECSNPVNNSIRCDACNKRRTENRKKNYQEWKEKGLCCQCGKETLNNKNYCEKHYLMKISHARLGTQTYWKELKKLIEKQDYKCALTGDVISFDMNIELDHKLPKYRGGLNDLLNVQWVTKEANWFKRALTETELLILCEKIISTLKK